MVVIGREGGLPVHNCRPGTHRETIAMVTGGTGGRELGAAGRLIRDNTTCMAAPHTPCVFQ